MTQNWHQIWRQRGRAAAPLAELQRLMTWTASIPERGLAADDWREYVRIIADRLAITNRGSVYEVGCGSGAFLFDYAASLIDVVRQLFAAGDFPHQRHTNLFA
jgi:fructoselysine-6-P-deglycase FrlB-like protein